MQQKVIAHVVYRLSVGGLENGLVNLINSSPADKYRHIVISLTEHTDFRLRIKREDTQFYELHKKEGKDYGVYFRLWRLLRKLRPDILHTRNVGTLECVVPAFLAGVKSRIHGEHGRDMVDIDGTNKKFIFLRRLCSPFVSTFVALSQDLEQWLVETVLIPKRKVVQFYNGVDTERFFPALRSSSKQVIIGTVGRLSAEKDQMTLLKAFVHLKKLVNDGFDIHLLIVGDGPLMTEIEQYIKDEDIDNVVELVGEVDDTSKQLRRMDIFVLPSLGEGISNTILEAMACGLPVVATNVGGNPELIRDGGTGYLVAPDDPVSMAKAIKRYLTDTDVGSRHGAAGRKLVEERFSIGCMVGRYVSLYDSCIK